MAHDIQPTGAFLTNFRTEMDRLFDDFSEGFLSPFGRLSRPPTALVPPAEVAEDETGYRIATEFPGIDQKDIDINVTGNVLMLRAERRQDEERRGRNYHLRERSYGTVGRQFRLPTDVDVERISAEMRNGVLTLILPKTQDGRNQRRRIEIKAS